jgi:clathrin interactor 1
MTEKYSLSQQTPTAQPPKPAAPIINLKTTPTIVTTPKPAALIEELDSDDDDLPAYDLSNDTVVQKVQAPAYLIDLKNGLLVDDNPELFTLCVQSAEHLIWQQLPNNDTKMAVELLRLFLVLEQKCYMEDYEGKIMSAAVAVCAVHPKAATEYLCGEFHTETTKYSVAKRIFMLDILGETARQLAKLEVKVEAKISEVPAPKAKKLLGPDEDAQRRTVTRRLLRERIEQKTRRFATKSKNPLKGGSKNRFVAVAGYFFYPLLHGYGKQQFVLTTKSSFKCDTDNLLLIHFLHTIACIMLSAENCLVAPKFAREILSLSQLLRFSEEPRVRLAVLQMISAIFLAVSKAILRQEFYDELSELRLWLEACVENVVINSEPNEECRQMARHLLVVCVGTLVEE